MAEDRPPARPPSQPPPPLPSQPPNQPQHPARAMPFPDGNNEGSLQHDPGHGAGAQGRQDQGPGQEQAKEKNATYSERLRSNIRYDQKIKRNVLEISLTKENTREPISITQELVFRILTSIKMDIKTEYQGHFNRYGKTPIISVLCYKNVNLEKFCRNENIQISAGLKVSNIRPAHRREVVVTVVGLDWSTPDTLVHEYLGKFGTMVKKEVIYCRYNDGPLKGGFNSDRQYFYDFSDSTKKPGTFHILDSSRIKIFFKGNTSTCARCHKTRLNCPGGGYAKDCEESKGARISLADHMRKLWNEIGFIPSDFTLPEEEEELDEDQNQILGDVPIISQKPPPKKAVISDDIAAKHNGLQLNNLPADLSDDEIKTFLQEKVSASLKEEDYRKKVGTNTTIYIDKGITKKEIEEAIRTLDRHTNGEKKIKFQGREERFIYCKPTRDLTPEKKVPPEDAAKEQFASKDIREKRKDAKRDNLIISPTQQKITSMLKTMPNMSTPVSTIPESLLHTKPSTLEKMKAEGVVSQNPLAQVKRTLDPASPTGHSPPSSMPRMT